MGDTVTPSIGFIQAGPGGLCFAHGPYEEGQYCPQWPACVTDPQNPEYVALGKRRVWESQERPKLESTVARTFIQWRRTVDPSERSRLWNAMEEAVRELEKLNNE